MNTVKGIITEVFVEKCMKAVLLKGLLTDSFITTGMILLGSQTGKRTFKNIKNRSKEKSKVTHWKSNTFI